MGPRPRRRRVPTHNPERPPAATFRETLSSGGEGQEMVVIPAGRFRMGCLSNDADDDADCNDNEKPVHEVRIAVPFAPSVHEVTFGTTTGSRTRMRWTTRARAVARRDQRVAGRRAGIRGLAVGADWLGVPAAEQKGMGVRGGGGLVDEIQLGGEVGGRANCTFCDDRWEHTAPVGSSRANGFQESRHTALLCLASMTRARPQRQI